MSAVLPSTQLWHVDVRNVHKHQPVRQDGPSGPPQEGGDFPPSNKLLFWFVSLYGSVIIFLGHWQVRHTGRSTRNSVLSSSDWAMSGLSAGRYAGTASKLSIWIAYWLCEPCKSMLERCSQGAPFIWANCRRVEAPSEYCQVSHALTITRYKTRWRRPPKLGTMDALVGWIFFLDCYPEVMSWESTACICTFLMSWEY